MAGWPVAGLFGGEAGQLLKQAVGVAVTLVFAGGGTWLLAAMLDRVQGLRVPDAHERDGIDIAAHGERGYHL